MTYEEQIEEIMDYFDFEKVHKAMVALEWKWFSEDGVPPIAKLRQKARYLLREVARDGPDTYCATGGFAAHCNRWNSLSLTFNVAEWHVESGD